MDKYRKKIEKALEAGDTAAVRRELLDIALNHADNAGALDAVKLAISQSKDLFVKDNGAFRFEKRRDWSAEYRDRLVEALKSNFSREKLSALVEVELALKSDSEASEGHETAKEDTSADAGTTAACVIEDGADVCAETESPAESVSEFIDAAAPEMHLSEKIPADDQWSHPARRKMSGVKIAGYVMMLLSLAAIIVALCIPITWLLGAGIAVFMIATAVAYLNLRA